MYTKQLKRLEQMNNKLEQWLTSENTKASHLKDEIMLTLSPQESKEQQQERYLQQGHLWN